MKNNEHGAPQWSIAPLKNKTIQILSCYFFQIGVKHTYTQHNSIKIKPNESQHNNTQLNYVQNYDNPHNDNQHNETRHNG
jgi:hypothetical protein